MLGQPHGEGARQPNRQHLGAKRPGKFGAPGDPVTVGDAELAIAIDGCGSHQVADAFDEFRVRLAALCEPLDDMLEQPDALVRP